MVAERNEYPWQLAVRMHGGRREIRLTRSLVYCYNDCMTSQSRITIRGLQWSEDKKLLVSDGRDATNRFVPENKINFTLREGQKSAFFGKVDFSEHPGGVQTDSHHAYIQNGEVLVDAHRVTKKRGVTLRGGIHVMITRNT